MYWVLINVPGLPGTSTIPPWIWISQTSSALPPLARPFRSAPARSVPHIIQYQGTDTHWLNQHAGIRCAEPHSFFLVMMIILLLFFKSDPFPPPMDLNRNLATSEGHLEVEKDPQYEGLAYARVCIHFGFFCVFFFLFPFGVNILRHILTIYGLYVNSDDTHRLLYVV